MPDRLQDLIRFYACMERLELKTGRHLLSCCHGKMPWPMRGVYFFMEQGQERSDSGAGLRVVRVGTHAVSKGSKTTLWKRLSQHRGSVKTGGGNHRGSIFRHIVGAALDTQSNYKTWEDNVVSSRASELPLEQLVSGVIGNMPFVVLEVEGVSNAENERAYIEKNSIALLSNYNQPSLDAPSTGWLGNKCPRPLVQASGLWNQKHVEGVYDPAFLKRLEELSN